MTNEMQLYFHGVTPYEYFSYNQAGAFYNNSLALQAGQIAATQGAGDRIANAISSQNYYLAAQDEATNRVYWAIQSQDTILRDIRTEIRGNTRAVERHAELLITQNQQLGTISDHLVMGNHLLSEQNTTLDGIARMLAQAYKIDLSDIYPKRYPPPTITPPPSLPSTIKSTQSQVDMSVITLDVFHKLFGEATVSQATTLYKTMSDDQLNGVQPAKLADRLILATYKRGKTAEQELLQAIQDYTAEQLLLDSTVRETIVHSHAQSLLEEVNTTIWQDCEGSVLPIIVDLNYGEIPGADRQVIAGYQLVTPPRYRPAGSSFTSISIFHPMTLEYFPTEQDARISTNRDILILDGDTNKRLLVKPPAASPRGDSDRLSTRAQRAKERRGGLFSRRLHLTPWETWAITRAEKKERFLRARYSIFSQELESEEWWRALIKDPYQIRTQGFDIAFTAVVDNPGKIPDVLGDSQSLRAVKRNLPQDLNALSESYVKAEEQRIAAIIDRRSRREGAREAKLKELDERMELVKPGLEDEPSTLPEITLWDKLTGRDARIIQEYETQKSRVSKARAQEYYALRAERESMTVNGRLPDESYYEWIANTKEEAGSNDAELVELSNRQTEFALDLEAAKAEEATYNSLEHSIKQSDAKAQYSHNRNQELHDLTSGLEELQREVRLGGRSREVVEKEIAELERRINELQEDLTQQENI